jgi:hypothetical protein
VSKVDCSKGGEAESSLAGERVQTRVIATVDATARRLWRKKEHKTPQKQQRPQIHRKSAESGSRQIARKPGRNTGSGAERNERTDYFAWPGYSDEGYDYDGMFAWFSLKDPHVRLDVGPPVIQNHKKELAGFFTTKAVVGFPSDKPIPKTFVKKLVKTSIRVMKDRVK